MMRSPERRLAILGVADGGQGPTDLRAWVTVLREMMPCLASSLNAKRTFHREPLFRGQSQPPRRVAKARLANLILTRSAPRCTTLDGYCSTRKELRPPPSRLRGDVTDGGSGPGCQLTCGVYRTHLTPSQAAIDLRRWLGRGVPSIRRWWSSPRRRAGVSTECSRNQPQTGPPALAAIDRRVANHRIP